MNGAGYSESYPLEWIDQFIDRVRAFVVVREADSLLIKVPNEAYKLNAAGVGILKRLLAGESIGTLWETYGNSSAVRRDLYHFFTAMKLVLEGKLNEYRLPPGVTTRPFALGFNVLPVLSEVALTYRCNLGCRFCYAGCGCKKSDRPAHEMNGDELRHVLNVVRFDAQAPSVSFTGGEPTLRADLPEIIAYASRNLSMRVNLITNGTLLDARLVRALQAAGLASAQVSLEATDAATHDALTRKPGSFERSLAGISRLQEAGIRVHTNTTLNRMNRDAALSIPAFVRSLGLDRFSMNLIIPAGSSREADPDINLTYSSLPVLIDRIQDAARRSGVEFMWYSPTPGCIFNPIQHQLGNKSCAACDGLLSISPVGDVLPCSSWPEPVGNILREDFHTVWQSAKARWLREKSAAPETCTYCEDFALCQGACPLYWRHFGTCELTASGERHVTATA